MVWYKKIPSKYKKAVIFLCIFLLTILVWHFGLGKNFEWKSFAPLSIPSLNNQTLYSIIAYWTAGALLYETGFYLFLYILFVRILQSRRLYRAVKKDIWKIIIFITYSLLSFIVNALNIIISIISNLFYLLVYLLPSIGISLLLFFPYLLFINRKRK